MTQAIGFSAGHLAIVDDTVSTGRRQIEVVLRWRGRVVDVKRFSRTAGFSIGTQADDDVFVPIDGGSWTLLTMQAGHRCTLHLRAGLSGTIARGEQSLPLSSLLSSRFVDDDAIAVPVADDMVVTIAFGVHTLQIRTMPKTRAVLLAPVFDALWANAALVSVFAMTALIAALFLHPVDMDLIDRDVGVTAMRLQTIVLRPLPKPTTPLDTTAKAHSPDDAPGAGRTASKRRPPTNARDAVAVDNDNDNDKAVAVAALSALAAVGEVIGVDNDVGAFGDALAAIDGAKMASAHGVGRLGVRGEGVGSSVGLGTLASGEIATRGRRFGDGRYGEAGGDVGAQADRDVELTREPGVVIGSLDPDIIRGVVRDHAGQVRYCYETALARTPGLAGKVTMKWVINAEGRVAQAAAASTDLGSAVDACLASRIKTWVFPKPKGGGIVVVTYPFVFKQAG